MSPSQQMAVSRSADAVATRRDAPSPLTIRLLAEGDAETRDSWSGSSNSLLGALRTLGHQVVASDVASPRWEDWWSKAVTFAPPRPRWVARHHYGPVGFGARSRRARRALSSHIHGQPVIQIGATFDATAWCDGPVYCYCDANAVFAARGGAFSPVRRLTPSELSAMIAREQRVYERAAGVFAMSECLRRSFIDDFGISPERVVTVPAGPNMRAFPAESDLEQFRAAAPTVLFVGRQFERKGGPLLVQAFKRVREEIRDARLVIAGCTPSIGALPGVSVVGPLSTAGVGPGSLTRAYQEAHLFCMPSHYEPFGVVFVEAMMHALPCVGADAWAMPELMEHGRSGWLVQPNDVDGLARTLIEGLSDSARLRTMGAYARQRAGAVFTWSAAAQRMADTLYRNNGRR